MNHTSRVLALLAVLVGISVIIAACVPAPLPVEPRPAVDPDSLQTDATIYVQVDEMPEPVGGLRAVQERAHFPRRARTAGIQGTVVVEFIVHEDGSVSDLNCALDPGGGLCQSAKRAIRQTEFIPGRLEGEPVKVHFALPVRFLIRR